MKAVTRYYWPTVLWALFVLVMCSIHLSDVTDLPLFFPGFDKLVHCGFFFVMIVFAAAGYLVQQSSRNLSYKALSVITALAIAYGGLIEVLQHYIFTWRSGDLNDFFADIIGALMAAFSIIITTKALNYEKK